MLLPTFGQQDHGAQVDRLAPKPAQQFAVNFDVLDQLGIGIGRLYGRDTLGQRDFDRVVRRGIQMDFLRLAVEVPRLRLPVLPFALIGRQFHGMAVGQVKRLVDIEHGLDIVVAGGNVFQAVSRIAKRGGVHNRRRARREPIHIHPKRLLRCAP